MADRLTRAKGHHFGSGGFVPGWAVRPCAAQRQPTLWPVAHRPRPLPDAHCPWRTGGGQSHLLHGSPLSGLFTVRLVDEADWGQMSLSLNSQLDWTRCPVESPRFYAGSDVARDGSAIPHHTEAIETTLPRNPHQPDRTNRPHGGKGPAPLVGGKYDRRFLSVCARFVVGGVGTPHLVCTRLVLLELLLLISLPHSGGLIGPHAVRAAVRTGCAVGCRLETRYCCLPVRCGEYSCE